MSASLDLSCVSGFSTSLSKRSDTFMGDFTIKKSFLEKSLDVSLNFSNLIQRDIRYQYNHTDYYSERISKPSSILVSLSLTYNFNKFKYHSIRKPSEDTGSNE